MALHYFHYNFCRIHKTLRVTPAMAAGVTDHAWDMKDLAAMISAKEEAEAPKTRGPYKKRGSLTAKEPTGNLGRLHPVSISLAYFRPNVGYS